MKSSRTLPITVAFLLSTTLLPAQQPLRFAPAFRNYTTDQGLPNNGVYDIYQDKTGYIWIASNQGICRFDGYTFEQFPDTLYTNSTPVMTGAMAEDARGRIWYVDFQSRVFYIENGAIHPYRYNDVIAAQKGKADFFHGLMLQGAGEELWLVSHAYGGILHLWGNGQCARIGAEFPEAFTAFEKNGKSQYSCNGITRRTDDYRDIYLHQGDSMYTLRLPFPFKGRFEGGYALHRLSDDRWCMYLAGFLYLIQHGKLIWMVPLENTPLSLLEEPNGALLVGYRQQGLARYGSIEDFRADKQQGRYLPGLTISKILRDREGGYWIATQQQGIFYCPMWEGGGTVQLSQPLTQDISSITWDGQNRLFASSEDGAVFEMDLRAGQWKTLPKTGCAFVRSVHFDNRTQTLAVAGNPAVFYRTNRWETFPFKFWAWDQLRDLSSLYLAPTSGGTQWLAATTGRLVRFSLDKPFVFSDVSNDDLHAPKRFFAVTETPDGRVWASGKDGLWEWKAGAGLHRPEIEHPAFQHSFLDIAVLPDSSLVFAPKGHGIVIWKPGSSKLTEIGPKQGLLFDRISALHVAPSGSIWACTSNGLVKCTPTGPRQYHINQFTVKHGLPTNTVNDVMTTPDGSVWVATAKGLFRFRDDFTEAPIPAPLFEHVSVNGVAYAAAALHTLPHDSANLVAKFLSLHFRSNGDIPYRFRLLQAGGDTTWTHTHSQTVHFSNLAPGDYRFQVQAQNEEARWSAVSTLAFTIRPPWWATWWSRMTAATALGMLAFGFYRYRVGQIKKEGDLREELYRLEQSALQAQMNPHFIFNCLNSIQYFILKNESDAAVLYLARFAKLVRGALNASVNGSITLEDEIKMLDNYLALEQMRFQKTFDYTITANENLDRKNTLLPPLLVQPFVENAVLHGMKTVKKDGHIGVTFQQVDGYLCINIRDNGPGLQQQPHNAEGKIPLGGQITQRRLELLQQRNSGQSAISVTYQEPESGTGTWVELRISSIVRG
jgi:ligand-binding sensor domain-containing protein